MALGNWFQRKRNSASVERRQSERIPVGEIVRIESRGTPVGLGRLKDVSLGGAYLETSRRSQRKGRLRVRLTSLDASVDDACWIDAEVTHGDRHGVGLKWQDFAPAAVVDLLSWQKGQQRTA
jgi:hypothetical protein